MTLQFGNPVPCFALFLVIRLIDSLILACFVVVEVSPEKVLCSQVTRDLQQCDIFPVLLVEFTFAERF